MVTSERFIKFILILLSMKTIYTAEPIEGIVEFAHPPVQTRLAREKLKAIIEESLMPMGLVTSYTITEDRAFPFPFEMPNAMSMNGFFGENPDYNQVAQELKELFEQPQREYAEFEAKLKSDLETATDDQILEMVEIFHYTPQGTRERHTEAVAKVRELWKPYDKMSANVEAQDYNRQRSDLVGALATLDDCHVQGLLRNVRKTEELLKAGKRDEAVEQVMHNYSDWRRKNLAHLHNACGDAKFYGAGFSLARLVAPDGEVEVDKYKFGERAPKTAEKALDNMRMPYQVILL